MKPLTIKTATILSLATLAALMASCRDDTIIKGDAAANDASADANVNQQDGTADGAGVDGPTLLDTNGSDLALASCPASIAWTTSGGMVAYRDSQALKTCTDFTLTRKTMRAGGKTESCQTTIATGDPNISALLVALARKDVKDALNGSVTFYGRDSRPADGVAFSVTVAGKTLLIGDPCGGKSGCTTIPTGLQTLRMTLRAITAAERKDPACSKLAKP